MSEFFFCEKSIRCKNTTSWTEIEKTLRQTLQNIFEQVGIGAGEKTYHDATFAKLCQIKSNFECAHVKCSLHTETVAPIFLENDQLPCGFMRSDIVLQWTDVTKKRKQLTETTVYKCVLELKATSTLLASAAIMQILCYMKSFNASKGLVCNFTQKCDAVQNLLQHKPEKIQFSLDKQSKTISLVENANTTTKITPTVEIYVVELQ